MRKPTQTLEFWQFDVGLFDDGKIIDLNEQYGPLGEAVYFRILCYISKSNGYYAELNDALILYIYRSIGSKWIRNRRIISEVISYCGVCGLFDVNLLSQSIITSCGIQRRWLYAKTKSRAQGYSTAKFWLLEDEPEPELSNHTENYDNCNNKADNCNNKADNCNKNTDIKERQDNSTEINTTQEEEEDGESSSPNDTDENIPQTWGGKLGQGVLVLSDRQAGELFDMMPLDVFERYCVKLSSWIRQNRPVKNHYELIKKWYYEDYGNIEEEEEEDAIGKYLKSVGLGKG